MFSSSRCGAQKGKGKKKGGTQSCGQVSDMMVVQQKVPLPKTRRSVEDEDGQETQVPARGLLGS